MQTRSIGEVKMPLHVSFFLDLERCADTALSASEAVNPV
ncbi:MAG: hypothetical protein JWR51_3482 [Devosia sp.]|nr:hypothetical protein [Devosia sp.]